MFFYIEDYFHKRLFHVLLIIFCGLLTFNSIMTLIDLKNYDVAFDFSQNDCWGYQVEKVDGKRKVAFFSPKLGIGYKFNGMPHNSGWVGKEILAQNISIERYTVEYKVYDRANNLIDTIIMDYPTSRGRRIVKEYELGYISVDCTIVDYDIKFNKIVYIPHIFVIVGSLFFIVPSAVMLFKKKKQENGR